MMKKGPMDDDRIYLTLGIVLREYGEEHADICPIPAEVAAFTGFPLSVIENHFRELRLRRILVLRTPAEAVPRYYSPRPGRVPFPRPYDTYWLNDWQLYRFTKQAPDNMQFVYPQRYFRRLLFPGRRISQTK
jgi:hypothetical protein